VVRCASRFEIFVNGHHLVTGNGILKTLSSISMHSEMP